MEERKEDQLTERALALLDRHWKWLIFATWLLFCLSFVISKWADIRAFNLGDTDDNMRMMQVRALLHGQDWFDLRDYRLNPPFGANIHWSHLVDLPLAGLILGLRPFIGGPYAELVAVAVAPMIPYLVLLFGIALTARGVIDRRAFLLPAVPMFLAGMTNSMFMPERIDHHGWQIALLALSMAGLADPKRLRGGILLGISSALSLAIGLEMIVNLAIAGSAAVLFWVSNRDERQRLLGYAISLGGSLCFCFVAFGSYANWLPVCDALSPVWLSDGLIACALLFGMSIFSPADWKVRLALAFVAGLIISAFHLLLWPQCLENPENLSPEAYSLWLKYVREARPVYVQGWKMAVQMMALPVTGAVGWLLLAWHNRKDRDLLCRTLGAAAVAVTAMGMMFWQIRTAPAAQMLGAVGAVALIWVIAPVIDRVRNRYLSTFGLIVVALVGLGVVVPVAMALIPGKKASPGEIAVGRANRLCNLIGEYRPIALLPKGTVFTFVDLAPRLITVTHHNSIMGPYHRNSQQIIDVMKAFRGSVDQAHAIIAGKYHSDYLLTCPHSSTTTIFMSEVPNGFYGQLTKGKVPNWLKPIPLPKDSPFQMWKVVG
jgi:hypothetical protein